MLAYFNPHISSTKVEVDPYYSQVVFLARCNGANGSTTLLDDSVWSTTNEWDMFGPAEISTDTSKFGSSSLKLSGSGSYVYGQDNSFVSVTNNDFTIEFWFMRGNQFGSGPYGILDLSRNTPADDPCFDISTNGSTFRVWLNDQVRWTASTSSNRWYHVALVRRNNVVRFYLDGNQVGSTYNTSTSYDSGTMTLGTYLHTRNSNSTNKFTGYIDSIRITRVARYTSNFNPPSRIFPSNGPHVSSLSFLSSITSTGSQVHIPSSGIAAGDFAVYFDFARSGNNSNPDVGTPSGWTSLTMSSGSYSVGGSTDRFRGRISYKILTTGDIGSIIHRSENRNRGTVVAFFRPNQPINSIIVVDPGSQATTGNPFPRIVQGFPGVGAGRLIVGQTATAPSGSPGFNSSTIPAFDDQIGIASVVAGYKIAPVSSHVIDSNQQGSANFLGAGGFVIT